MAFGFLKKIAKTIVKPVAKIVKIIPRPISNLIYETVVPAPARKIIANVTRVGKPVALVLKLRGGSSMNPFEKVLREMADVIKAIQDKEGTIELVSEVVELLVALGPVYEQLGDMSIVEKRSLLKQGLDNVIGEEADALFGPGGSLVKFDIPFVNDEKATDLVIDGMVNLAIKEKDVSTN